MIFRLRGACSIQTQNTGGSGEGPKDPDNGFNRLSIRMPLNEGVRSIRIVDVEDDVSTRDKAAHRRNKGDNRYRFDSVYYGVIQIDIAQSLSPTSSKVDAEGLRNCAGRIAQPR